MVKPSGQSPDLDIEQPNCGQQEARVLLLYRLRALDPASVQQLVRAFFAELARKELHIPIFLSALDASGFLAGTDGKLPCARHEWEHNNRLSDLSDLLLNRLRDDLSVAMAVGEAFRDVLRRVTVQTPSTHLTSAEAAALSACNNRAADTRHISDYEMYTRLWTHALNCSACSDGHYRNHAS